MLGQLENPTLVMDHDKAPRRGAQQVVNRRAKIDLVNALPLSHDVNVMIREVSVIDIGFICPVPIDPGHDVVLYLDRDTAGILYHVVRCVPANKGYFVSAEFLCALPSDDDLETPAESDDAAIARLREIILG